MPELAARTVEKYRQLELTVLKQRAEQQQISLSIRLKGLKESEMNAECKQQHSLSAYSMILASKLSIQVVYFFQRFWQQAQALVYCITTTHTEQETRCKRLCTSPPSQTPPTHGPSTGAIWNNSWFLRLYKLVDKCTSPLVKHLPNVDD